MIDKPEISYLEFINNYNNLYKPRQIKFKEQIKREKNYLFYNTYVITYLFNI